MKREAPPTPDIIRKLRADRRRITALVAAGLAGVVVAGASLSSFVGLPQLGENPGNAESPTSQPSSSSTGPLGEYDRTRGDVDGDGANDTIRIMVPTDVADIHDDAIVSEDTRLRVELTTGPVVEARLGKQTGPSIHGAADLDGNGTSEVMLQFTGGGESGLATVFTWDGDAMVQAEPANDTPADLVADSDIVVAVSVVAALVDGRLISWVPPDDHSVPFEARVWTWQLDGTSLVATEEDQPWCIDRGERPSPC